MSINYSLKTKQLFSVYLTLTLCLPTLCYLQEKHIDVSRKVYERLMDTYPTCGRFWKLYIEEVGIFIASAYSCSRVLNMAMYR